MAYLYISYYEYYNYHHCYTVMVILFFFDFIIFIKATLIAIVIFLNQRSAKKVNRVAMYQ